ncbi:conserved hypothetical protein [Burkholderia vietnamiensis]|nr:conserved hypothetical protein [Burkholderia vietnamiensis]SOT46165.1 hypothetical protein F01_570151 [Burkholderia cenocepacia]
MSACPELQGQLHKYASHDVSYLLCKVVSSAYKREGVPMEPFGMFAPGVNLRSVLGCGVLTIAVAVLRPRRKSRSKPALRSRSTCRCRLTRKPPQRSADWSL